MYIRVDICMVIIISTVYYIMVMYAWKPPADSDQSDAVLSIRNDC